MSKQSCTKCGHEFLRKEVVASIRKGYRPITCSSCGEVHLINDFSKLIIAMVVTLPIIFLLLFITSVFSMSPSQILITGVIVLAASIFSVQFIAKYETEENRSSKI
ncbi:TIGR04104 family putative zinc finger protein [Alkalihalobacterium alkalinitrilicum]|uniref:TIGR04104 family putative zinc finger protein n=1 Tax=Alkalihalobacterium alkalinitrilicum TaxID=427920 RepID=UPI0009951A5C|nr:TIGR04104 family putative zinc finger protein [Alkalihalobacterium alkalinitrilicum]